MEELKEKGKQAAEKLEWWIIQNLIISVEALEIALEQEEPNPNDEWNDSYLIDGASFQTIYVLLCVTDCCMISHLRKHGRDAEVHQEEV